MDGFIELKRQEYQDLRAEIENLKLEARYFDDNIKINCDEF